MPEGRQIFPTLTVEENLVATAAARFGAPRWTLRARLRASSRASPSGARNLGNQLSGGEQQMLAIGRALMTNPKLLILDEATEGLAPLIRAEIWACLARLKAEGQAILLVDKHLEALTRIADRHVVIEKGHVGVDRHLGGAGRRSDACGSGICRFDDMRHCERQRSGIPPSNTSKRCAGLLRFARNDRNRPLNSRPDCA